ncbi:MAG: pyrroline-5-carboxylate reductase [Proteobacteria bacterium]|nr:pyrroline-5-carboxylate reductase [Pseudomonadota bacterium]
MFEQNTVTFIGAGNMAEAMIKGILVQELVEPQRILAADPRLDQAEFLAERYGIRTTTDNRAATHEADILILSIKPQVLQKVMNEINLDLDPSALVLSIIAGARIGMMTKGLRHASIVRSMPNTPGQFGVGMTVWTSTPHVTEQQRVQAQSILQALGKEIWMEDEHYLDMATALSGTGPAYIFMFVESLIDAGVHMGFSRHIAEELVLQTIEGSIAVVRELNRHPATLRNMVTSPGGTSASAIYELDKGGFRTIISKAVFAAYRRSVELGDTSEAQLTEQLS